MQTNPDTTTAPSARPGTANGPYYDPNDVAIDKDPYPVWKRLRDEQPLSYNEKHDFCALSRFDDVETYQKDWRRYTSSRGTLLEPIKAGVQAPPGTITFEDPPAHEPHRALLTSAFTPRRIAALEPKVCGYCARSLDPLLGKGRFDFIADIGAPEPNVVWIPESDQQSIRDWIDDGFKLSDGAPSDALPRRPRTRVRSSPSTSSGARRTRPMTS